MRFEEVRDALRLESGQRPVVVKGRFDVLQAEHCRRLSNAKKQGSTLIVLVAAGDRSQKAPLDERARAELVAALAAVDYVIICDEAETERLASALQPAVLLDAEQPPPRDIIADVLQRQDVR